MLLQHWKTQSERCNLSKQSCNPITARYCAWKLDLRISEKDQISSQRPYLASREMRTRRMCSCRECVPWVNLMVINFFYFLLQKYSVLTANLSSLAQTLIISCFPQNCAVQQPWYRPVRGLAPFTFSEPSSDGAHDKHASMQACKQGKARQTFDLILYSTQYKIDGWGKKKIVSFRCCFRYNMVMFEVTKNH